MAASSAATCRSWRGCRTKDKLIHAPWLAKPEQLADAGVKLGRDYPLPAVDHAVQRELALALFKR
ncbi:FAD-binding domain-containing protein [Chromobacterium piscinae]|uniref:FAD-binding domain-containing protein n=1 Tax=Chromobacterium piscinae TaxID=686831 RepID=UPI0031FD8ACA